MYHGGRDCAAPSSYPLYRQWGGSAMRRVLIIALAIASCLCATAQPDPQLRSDARAALTAAVDAFAAPDIAQGVVDIDNMAQASIYETERPPVYARVFRAASDATGEQRFRDWFLAVADLAVAIKQPEGGYSRKAWVKRVGATETQQGSMTFRNSRGMYLVQVILQAYDYTGDERYLNSVIETAEWALRSQHEDGAWQSDYPAPEHSYLRLHMLNDGVTISPTRTLMMAYARTDDARYLDAIKRAGDWFIRNQLPEPTPGWAQEYYAEDRAAWGRRFEPPAACSAPTSSACGLLIDIYLLTGDDRYLAPIPAALAWLERSQLPDGNWARFYELKTNRPLYFTSDDRTTYRLTYDDSDAPDHYSFKGNWGFSAQKTRYGRLQEVGRETLIAEEAAEPTTEALAEKVLAMEQSVRDLIAPDGRLGKYPTEGGHVTRLASDSSWVALYATRYDELQRRRTADE